MGVVWPRKLLGLLSCSRWLRFSLGPYLKNFQGPANDLAWYYFAPDDGAQENWNDVLTPEQFAPYVAKAEPR